MKSPEIFEAKKGEAEGEGEEKKAPRPALGRGAELPASAKEFFEVHKDFLESYTADSSIEIKPSPPKLGTFAIDLQKGVMYAEPKFFTERGYSPDKTMFATLHEFEHFRELRELLSDKGGEKVWKEHLAKIKASKRFKIFDNCFDDIKMNRAVVSRAPSVDPSRTKLYAENLFADRDFTKQPKHLQFSYAILRERMLTDEQCAVAPEVRAELDRLENIKSGDVSLLDYASDPKTPMALRLELQKRFLEPVLEKFFEEDVKEKEEEGDGDGGEGEGEGEEGEGKEGESEDGGEEGKDKKPTKGKKGKNGKKTKKGSEKFQNPEDYFQAEYDNYFKKNPEPISEKEIEKAVKDFLESKKGEKSPDEMTEEAYARSQGVSPEDLRAYRRFYEQLENIKNPETGESVTEEIREIFKKIITERLRPRLVSKLPVAEGEILARPAEAVAQVRAGVHEPEVWETVEPKERPKELFGDFEVTVVADRSGSMEGEKAREQRKAVALVLEALKEFSDELDEMRSDIVHDLNVRTESWSFGGKNELAILKPLSQTLSEKERVAVYKTLADTPGDHTKDFLALEGITKGIVPEDETKIRDKKMRKIIIVMSDGASDDPARVQTSLAALREKGVSIVGVGITADGAAITGTYAPDGLVCENVADLPRVLGELLKKEIAGLNASV